MTKAQKTKLNKLVREFVVLRDKVCLRCGKSDRLHASHIYPKGKFRKMQFNVDNVKALCLGCHLYWWHKHPIEAKEWAEKTLGKASLIPYLCIYKSLSHLFLLFCFLIHFLTV